MFSSLPKLADRAFVVGYLLPMLLFVFALVALFADQPLVQKLVSSEAQGWDKIVGLVVAVWTAAVFLQFINTSLIKFLEGYTYPVKGWRWLKKQREGDFDTLDCRLKELWNKINSLISLSEAETIELQRKSIELHAECSLDAIYSIAYIVR